MGFTATKRGASNIEKNKMIQHIILRFPKFLLKRGTSDMGVNLMELLK
jgi:hypothetical protein